MESSDIRDADVKVVLEVKHRRDSYELNFPLTGN